MSTTESGARDVLFLVDGSRSMNGKIRSSGMRKIKVVREGLTKYCLESWPVSYYPWPVRIGVAFFRLLGTPGSAVFEVVVPLNPEPPSLELFRLEETPMKGGSPLVDGIRYGLGILRESTREERRLKLIGDGDNDREEITACEDEVRSTGIPVDSVELSDTPSENMRRISAFSSGLYNQARTVQEFLEAVKR